MVLQNNSPRQIDHVVVMVTCLERTAWEEEVCVQRQSGEGDSIKRWTEYSYRQHGGERVRFRERVEVSQLSLQLAPGAYSYPFVYPLKPDLPATASYGSSRAAQNPARSGRPLTTSAEVSLVLEAYVETAGVFTPDLCSRQLLTVTEAVNYAALQPALGAMEGQVMVCCCIPRGVVQLTCAFDRAAYVAGETAGIKATINNQSSSDVTQMDVELVRTITIRDNGGASKTINDTMCRQEYPGVQSMQSAGRDLPLPLFSQHGPMLPGTAGALVSIAYQFRVSCEATCASSPYVSLPMVILPPQPTQFGLAAAGLQTPAGMTFRY